MHLVLPDQLTVRSGWIVFELFVSVVFAWVRQVNQTQCDSVHTARMCPQCSCREVRTVVSDGPLLPPTCGLDKHGQEEQLLAGGHDKHSSILHH